MDTDPLYKIISESLNDCKVCGQSVSQTLCIHNETKLIEFLSSDTPKIKIFGFSTLVRFNKISCNELIQVLNDDNPKVVLRGLQTIVTNKFEDFFGDKGLINSLNNLLESAEDIIVIWALNALYESVAFANSDTFERALELLKSHENYLCRENAAALLGLMANYGYNGSLLILVEHCLNDKIQVRKRALLALGEFDSSTAVNTPGFSGTLKDLFIQIARSKDLQLRQIAEDLIEVG